MKRFSGIAVFVLAAVFAATGTDTAAREKTVGMSLAYNEFSATFTMPVKDRETIMISANLDMSGVIPGECLFPGVSANVAYLYEFSGITFPSGESMGFLAGPGAGVGYIRDTSGAYGAMVSLTGCVNVNRLHVTSFHVDSITPEGFRSVSAAASATVTNGSVGFSVYDIGGTVKRHGQALGDFSVEPFSVKARSTGKYSINGQLSLAQSMSVIELLSIVKDIDLDDFTVDISLKVKAMGGAPQKLLLKDVPARQIIDIMKSGSV